MLPSTVDEAAAPMRAGSMTSVDMTTAPLEYADDLDPRLGAFLARYAIV
jgi:Asp-tRNA(Asn)/Glu-tRNA(Gln) amidotransferase A subunit family amidase